MAQEGGGGVMVVGGIDSLVLVEDGGSRSFVLDDWFSGEDLSFETTVSGGVGVVVVSVVDGRLVVGGVGAGSAAVSVTASDGSGGSGVVVFSVVVLESPGFTDTVGHTHEVGVARFVAEGVVRGCNPPVNDRFCPDRFLSRGEMATVMVRKFGLAVSGDDAGPVFTDTADSVHRSNIGVFAAEGVTRGCNPPVNDRFCPGRVVSRGEFASFLVRVLGLVGSDDGGFTDTSGSVHRGNIGLIAAEGITRGCNPPANTRFCPGRGLSRGEVATLLSRVESTDSGGGGGSSTTAPFSGGPVGFVPPVPSNTTPDTSPPQITPTTSPPSTAPTPTVSPELSLSVSEEFLDEADTRSATVSLNVDTAGSEHSFTVLLTFSGTATKDTDYTVSSEMIVIPSGQEEGVVPDMVTLTLGADEGYEGTENVVVSASLMGAEDPFGTADIPLYDATKPSIQVYLSTSSSDYGFTGGGQNCLKRNRVGVRYPWDGTQAPSRPNAMSSGTLLVQSLDDCYVGINFRLSEVPVVEEEKIVLAVDSGTSNAISEGEVRLSRSKSGFSSFSDFNEAEGLVLATGNRFGKLYFATSASSRANKVAALTFGDLPRWVTADQSKSSISIALGN